MLHKIKLLIMVTLASFSISSAQDFILVHGWTGNGDVWNNTGVKQLLQSYYFNHTIRQPSLGGTSSANDQALNLNNYLNSYSVNNGIGIVHSMGGITTRNYLKNQYQNNQLQRINKLYTIGTPHLGTRLADNRDAAFNLLLAGAATNNSLGIASLGWNVSLLLDYRWGSSSAVASVQELVDDRGADVINFSWVSSYSSQLANVIQYALQNGVVCVAAAGNDEWTIPGTRYPAAYNFGTDGQVIAVSGTQLTSGVEQFITGFNYSPGTNPINDPTNAFIDFAAPGTNYRALSDVSSTGYIHIWAGTSISAPFVSALVGLMLSVNSSLTPIQIYDILQRTSEKIGQYSYDTNGWNRYLGYGRIDAEDAVNAASGAPAKPNNLHFTYSNSEHPSLGWDANTESNISGYRIYREYDESGTWSSAGYVSHPTTTFIDYVVDYTKPIWAKTVRYRVKAVNSSSQYSVYSNMIETTGIMADPNIVASDKNETEKVAIENFVFALDQNYPNPFNPNTSISFSLPQKSFTSLKVFDILGKEVKVLVNDFLSEGNYSFNFDGNNLSSGLYIYQLSTNMGIVSRKMFLMK